MADTLTAVVTAKIAWNFRSGLDLATAVDSAARTFERTFAAGTAADSVDRLWHDQRSVAGGANDDLDLTALAQTIFGLAGTTSFAKVRGLLVINNAITSGDVLRVGPNGVANYWPGPWSASASYTVLGPGDALLQTNRNAGWSVSNGASDILRIANPGGNSITYDVVLLGTSV